MNKIEYYKLPTEWQELMLMRQVQAGNRINPGVFVKKIDASKAEGGFNFKEDKEVCWNDIFKWDGKKPLPNCPLPDYKYPKEDTLIPKAVEAPINFGGLTYKYLASTDTHKLYATKDTIRGMRPGRKSLVLVMEK